MRKKIKKNFLLYGALFSIFTMGYYFILKSFEENMMYFITPSDLLLKNERNNEIMLGGYVKDGSYQNVQDLQGKNLHIFLVTDFKQDIKVNYKGQIPNLFREGQGVIAKGRYNLLNNVFEAREILAKHDEKYTPQYTKEGK